MKQLTRILLITTILNIALKGCKFSYSPESENLKGIEHTTEINLSRRTLKFISENNIDSLKSIFSTKVIRRVKQEQLDWIMLEGQKVLTNYEFLGDTNIIVSQSINYSFGGRRTVKLLSLPFQNKVHKDSLKYFHITIADNKIYRLILNDNPPGMRITEPKHSEPHRNEFNLHVNNVRWFRIWYSDGSKKNNKYGRNIGHYAISGNKSKLKEIGVQGHFQEIFNLINKANFDSTDFKYLQEDRQGDSEWIYLRIRFDDEEYRKLGEFEISYFLNEENGKRGILSDYIIFKHTEKTRYLLLEEKNKDLVQKLREIAYHDYEKYYELFP